jgi:hypothetical protein
LVSLVLEEGLNEFQELLSIIGLTYYCLVFYGVLDGIFRVSQAFVLMGDG